jgi:hypothetical protein
MYYNVGDLSKDEFLRLWDLVLIAREDVTIPQLWATPVPLRQVSDREEDFSEKDRAFINKRDHVGMYAYDGQIWMKPGEPFHDMQDTVLHELSHHEVPHECHGPTWRKVFGTALALHLRECGASWGEVHCAVEDVVWSYRKARNIKVFAEQARVRRAEAECIVRSAKRKIPILNRRTK